MSLNGQWTLYFTFWKIQNSDPGSRICWWIPFSIPSWVLPKLKGLAQDVLISLQFSRTWKKKHWFCPKTTPAKETQTTSTWDSYKKTRPYPEDLKDIAPSADKSLVTYNKCAQSATARIWLQLLQRLTRKVDISPNDAQPVYNDLTAWRLNQGPCSIP